MASHADDTGGPSMIVAALPMLHCLAHLYHDRPCLSDMELIANGVSYPVHRVIISMHSCIFASHCRNCLPTAPTQTLEIGSPSGNDSVEATIQFMYTFDYDLPDRLRQDRQAPGAEAVHIHRVQEFHWQMVLVADSWHMQGLTYVATMKFHQNLLSQEVSVQDFIRYAKMTFGMPGKMLSLRKVLLSYAANTPALNIAIYPHDPRPLLKVSIETPNGERKRLNTINLSCDADYETPTKMDVYQCIKCKKDQWRDDIVSLKASYTCKDCEFASTGRGWGVDVKKKEEKAKKEDERLGRLFFCRGCGEGQMRIDIDDSQHVYHCNSCGLEKSGHVWEGWQSRSSEADAE